MVVLRAPFLTNGLIELVSFSDYRQILVHLGARRASLNLERFFDRLILRPRCTFSRELSISAYLRCSCRVFCSYRTSETVA